MQDPLEPLKLIDDLQSGTLDRRDAVEALSIVYNILIDKYDRFMDYNATTTQSDYGEMLHVLFSFLMLYALYDREAWNLMPERITHRVLNDIQKQTGLRVLDLPLVRPFNVDLGFRLNGEMDRPPASRPVRKEHLQEGDNDLLQALTTGMPLSRRPYLQIAQALNRSEEDVLERIYVLQEAGIISRLGVIVRHRALGWRSNAMVVWDIESEHIDKAGPSLAAHPGVTLCYERRPVEGIWPYRLYCMIHAQSRNKALETLTQASGLPERAGVPYQILVSSRCFKQTGAMIAPQGRAA